MLKAATNKDGSSHEKIRKIQGGFSMVDDFNGFYKSSC